MLYETFGQGRIFLLMGAAGVLIGLWYDLCGLLRRVLAAGPLLSLLADALFGLGAALLFAAASVAADWGRVRLYQVLAAALGALLYALSAGPLLRRLAGRASALFRRFARRVKENRIIKVIFR